MSDVFIARQPIFDAAQTLIGYELLYRPAPAATAAGDASPLVMSSATLVTGLLTFGLDQITGGARAFVNFPREMLTRRAFELLDPGKVTIELLETIACDDESVEAVKTIRTRGFDVALDDFAGGEEYHRLLELAQIVKVDVLNATAETLEPLVRRLRRYRVRLLAERVEDRAMQALCESLGFTLFQGYYFQRPETMGGRELPAGLVAIVRLMNLVNDAEATDRDVEAAFRADPALSYKLLQIVNSAAIGGLGIQSIQHAVQLVGRGTLHRWLSLLLVTAVPLGSGVRRELVLEALERGRMCELLAERSGHRRSAASAFLAGLLSNFDAILGVSMPDLLQHVRVSEDVRLALLNDAGPLTPYLAVASRYACGDWEPAIRVASELGVLDDLVTRFGDAGAWARHVLQVA